MQFRHLRSWLIAHSVVDLSAGIALFVRPAAATNLLGLGADEVVVRLVAAAIFAFGVATVFAANATRDTQRVLLATVLSWNTLAILALLLARQAGNPHALFITLPFLVFGFAFAYYLNRMTAQARA